MDRVLMGREGCHRTTKHCESTENECIIYHESSVARIRRDSCTTMPDPDFPRNTASVEGTENGSFHVFVVM